MKIASSLKMLACAASALALSAAANATVYEFSVEGNGQTYKWFMDLDPSVAYAGNIPGDGSSPVLPTFSYIAADGYFVVTDVQGIDSSGVKWLPGFTGDYVANVAFYEDGGLQLLDVYGTGLQLDFYGDKLYEGNLDHPTFLPTDGTLGSTSSPWTLMDDAGLSYTFSIKDCNCAPTGAVPEPATWGMMIAGFGIMGAALRSRRLRVGFGGKAIA